MSHKQGSLSITQGSGYFDISHANAKAKIFYDDKAHVIGLEPEREGSFVVSAFDLCLLPQDVATAQVLVSDVHRIIVTVVDKVRR